MFLLDSNSPIPGTDTFSFASVSAPDAPGEYDLAACEQYGDCQRVQGGMNYPDGGGLRDGALNWWLDRGVLRVLKPEAGSRRRATFSGSGTLYRYSAGEWAELGRITVTNGTLEVEVP